MLDNFLKALENQNDGDYWYELLEDIFDWYDIVYNMNYAITGYHTGSDYADGDIPFGFDDWAEAISNEKEDFHDMVVDELKKFDLSKLDEFKKIYDFSVDKGYDGSIEDFCNMLKKSYGFLSKIYEVCMVVDT